jgi:hypothetical protein
MRIKKYRVMFYKDVGDWYKNRGEGGELKSKW